MDYKILLAISVFTYGNVLRYQRWALLCDTAHIYQSKRDFYSYFTGRILNFIVPLKLGDLVRFSTVSRKDHLLPMAVIFGFERFIDLVFFFSIALLFHFQLNIDAVTIAFGLLSFVGILVIFSAARLRLARVKIILLTLWSLKRMISRKIFYRIIFQSFCIVSCIVIGSYFLWSHLDSTKQVGALMSDQLSVRFDFFWSELDSITSVLILSCLLPMIIPNSKWFPAKYSAEKTRINRHSDIESIAFFELTNKNKFSKIHLSPGERIERVFQGGSQAITYLTFAQNQFRVRKSARGLGKDVLEEQFRYMSSFKKYEAIPLLKIDQNSNDYFGYSMEFYENFKPLNELMYELSARRKIFNLLFENHQLIFEQNLDLPVPNFAEFIQIKIDRLLTMTQDYFQRNNSSDQAILIFRREIEEIKERLLRTKSIEQTIRSHGDFSASNILFDGRSFRYIDLLPPSIHSSRQSDFGKLFLTLLIELESRITNLNKDPSLLCLAPKLTLDGINHANDLANAISMHLDLERLKDHALLHLIRVLPYRITNEASANYWIYLFHEVYMHLSTDTCIENPQTNS
jgi:hypothetical protein